MFIYLKAVNIDLDKSTPGNVFHLPENNDLKLRALKYGPGWDLLPEGQIAISVYA